VDQALHTLLAGSELTVVQIGERRYQLQPGAGGALELGAISQPNWQMPIDTCWKSSTSLDMLTRRRNKLVWISSGN
jgi:hypothetical protein